MYRNILHPTDGSDGAQAALEHTRDLAEKYDATVHVMYVVETPTISGGMADDQRNVDSSGLSSNPKGEGRGMASEQQTGPQIQQQQTEQAEEVVEETARQLDGLDVETVIEHGEPHQQILEYADDGIDLIVMGTHGRTGVERYLLGSVTEKVVRLSDVPVVTVRQEQ
ncbi:MAG: universal stress protein [Halovenus sp.]|uniref:universal stress protein n=1 Tax=Halovenus amylolytica TaxID=2500550 RepID=UPI000FE36E35